MIAIDKFFGWFFNAVKGIIYLLDQRLYVTIGGVGISIFDFVLAFFVIHIVITFMVRSGGVRND